MTILAEIVGDGRTYFQLWCAGITTVILIWGLQARMRSGFRGAMVWPVLGVLPSLPFHWSHLYDWLTQLVIVNGGTFRLPGPWKCRLFTADPVNIEYLLKTRYHNFGRGEIFKDTFRDMLGDSILLQDGEPFKRLSVSFAKALSSPAFRDCVAAVLPGVMQQNFVPLFSHACEKAVIIDLQDMFQRLACYNTCLFGAGLQLDCLKPDLPKVPFLEAIEEATQSLMFRLLMPPFSWKILRYFNVLFERRILKAINSIYGFSIQACRSRGHSSPVADILSAFLQYEEESGRFYSEERKSVVLVNVIIAGKDNITAGLTWFFWLIAKHPLVEAQILAELREIVKERKSLDDQEPFSFTFEEVNRMDYLHAAITESLRLYPPVPIEYTASAEHDVLPDGTPVEKGAEVLYSIYSSARLEKVWGEDCLEFKPERWIKNGKFVRQSNSKFLAFNAGPRRCTGMEFSYWQMKWAAASILIRYWVKIVDKHPVLPKYGLSLLMKYGLLATIHQREIADSESGK